MCCDRAFSVFFLRARRRGIEERKIATVVNKYDHSIFNTAGSFGWGIGSMERWICKFGAPHYIRNLQIQPPSENPLNIRVPPTDSSTSRVFQERKISPKRKFLGRTSRGHPGVIGADIPAQNFGQGGQNPGKKNKHFGAGIHDPKARTSTTLRGFQKLRSEKLWAEFSFPRYSTDSLRYPESIAARGAEQEGRNLAQGSRSFALKSIPPKFGGWRFTPQIRGLNLQKNLVLQCFLASTP